MDQIAKARADTSGCRVVYGDRRLGKSVVGAAATVAMQAGAPVTVIDLATVTSVEGAVKAILDWLTKELGSGGMSWRPRWSPTLRRAAWTWACSRTRQAAY